MPRDVVVITNVQLHSTKLELRFCAGSNPACDVLEIRDGEDLWQWSRLEIRLNSFRRSTIPQKAIQFKLIVPFDINILDWFSIKVRRSDTSLPYLSKITLFSQNRGMVFDSDYLISSNITMVILWVHKDKDYFVLIRV